MLAGGALRDRAPAARTPYRTDGVIAVTGSHESRGQLELMVLSVLSRGSAHGYAVIEALREQSGGTFDFPEGTVYPALHKLEAAGLVTSTWEVVRGRNRRRYELSPHGEAVLTTRRNDWLTYSAGVNRLLGWSP